MRVLQADVLKKTFNDDLKVSEIILSCIHGSKIFKSEGTGKLIIKIFVCLHSGFTVQSPLLLSCQANFNEFNLLKVFVIAVLK